MERKISVIGVTNRDGAIKFYEEQLSKQTFKDFEFICANDSNDSGGFTPRQKNDGDAWNLNKAYNDCLDRAKGELLVFLQDFIWISANGLQRFWDIYQLYPNAAITGVGHKYEKDLKTINEVDARTYKRELVESNFAQWELNWASCPKSIMPRFRDEMDTHYGGENYHISKQIQDAGHAIYIDGLNECKGLSQEICGGRPDDWEPKHFNKIIWTQ